MKGFEDILRLEQEAGDGSEDIVIVSHAGVMNVILSNLRHRSLEEEMKSRIPNCGVVVLDFTNAKE